MICDAGHQIATSVLDNLKHKVALLKKKADITPGLVVISVEDRKDSALFARNKKKACEHVGALFINSSFRVSVSQEELIRKVNECNAGEFQLNTSRVNTLIAYTATCTQRADPRVHGIIVQLPLPIHIDERAVLSSVKPAKDVDGLHPSNIIQLTQAETHVCESIQPSYQLTKRACERQAFHAPCASQVNFIFYGALSIGWFTYVRNSVPVGMP
jgi:5,10-methylene-tetrahydrofolate dehydrogenase/methenyl tetrahydrofolate cyclohydrolase